MRMAREFNIEYCSNFVLHRMSRVFFCFFLRLFFHFVCLFFFFAIENNEVYCNFSPLVNFQLMFYFCVLAINEGGGGGNEIYKMGGK